MIHRIHKSKDYSVMSNVHLRDNNLSLKTKGLLSVMLSLPDDWDYSIAGLVAICKDGETIIRSALTELEENKYLVRSPLRKDGKICDWIYDIYERPQVVEKLVVENPQVENLQVENQAQLNTNKLNTNKLNKDIYPPISPFEEFWKVYPKKVGKLEAEKAFKRIKGVPLETIIKAIELQKNSDQWKKSDGQYIPNPSTWLNQGRWEDELNVPKENKPATADKPLPMSIRK